MHRVRMDWDGCPTGINWIEWTPVNESSFLKKQGYILVEDAQETLSDALFCP